MRKVTLIFITLSIFVLSGCEIIKTAVNDMFDIINGGKAALVETKDKIEETSSNIDETFTDFKEATKQLKEAADAITEVYE